jgi:hypothetical protein
VMPGGMRFAYVSAEGAGVPYIEIAHIPPEIRAFFDYVKQEQQGVPAMIDLREQHPLKSRRPSTPPTSRTGPTRSTCW